MDQYYGITEDEDTLIEKFKNAHLVLEPKEQHGSLYLGDIMAAESVKFLKDNNISCILTIAKTTLNLPKHLSIQTMKISVDDSPIVNLKSHFEACFKFIHENRSAGKNVLVHCMAGVSRSATIVIGYIMNTNDLDFETAYKLVKEKRFIASPNGGFLRQLMEYSKELEPKRKEQTKNQ